MSRRAEQSPPEVCASLGFAVGTLGDIHGKLPALVVTEGSLEALNLA